MRDTRPTALEAVLREAGVRAQHAKAIMHAVDRLKLRDMHSDDLAAALWLFKGGHTSSAPNYRLPVRSFEDPMQLTWEDVLPDNAIEG